MDCPKDHHLEAIVFEGTPGGVPVIGRCRTGHSKNSTSITTPDKKRNPLAYHRLRGLQLIDAVRRGIEPLLPG